MSRRLLVLLSLAAGIVPGIGCAVGSVERQLEEMTLKYEDSRREKAAVEVELLECRARCESLSKIPSGAPAASAEKSSDLEGVNIHRRGEDTVIDLPSDVFFTSGSSNLNSEGKRTMGEVARYVRGNHPDGQIRIEGHSDSDPIRRTKNQYHCNWDLSFERAHSVMHCLIDEGGFDPRRVVCESYGEHRPADPNNKSKNRRVEIVIAR